MVGQTIVVTNIKGISVAFEEFVKAPADGYTAMAYHPGMFCSQLLGTIPYTWDQFETVGIYLIDGQSAWFVGNDAPYQTMQDVVDAAMKAPVSYATEVGSMSHLCALQLMALAPGAQINVVDAGGAADKACPKDETCPMHPYVDTDKKLWYHDGVHYCIENGLMSGISKNEFAPNMVTNRAMIVTILWRMEDKPIADYEMTFKDVADGMWYTEAIRWAQSVGIVEGYNDDAYGPNDSITREQLASILWRYAKYKGYDVSVGEETNILSYEDAFSVSEWAIEAMQWACGAGLIHGIELNNTMYLAPKGDAIRSQSATVIYYFCTEVKK